MAEDGYPLSVIVHTKNSAATLEKCLQSVEFASEIVVVDMQSDDETKNIAKKFTKHVFSVEDSGYVETVRNFGLSKASEDWILLLDADEELSDGLKIWLESFLTSSKSQNGIIAYYVPRKNYMFGQEIRHSGWWPDYQLRLFKKGSVEWTEKIHSVPQVTGKTETLPADSEKCLVHYNYRSIEQFVDRMNHYTSITATESKLKGALSAGDLVETFGNEFVQRAFKWEGVKDGGLGVGLAFLQSTYMLLIKLKQWEANKFLEKDDEEEKVVAAIQKLEKTLHYWIADWQVKNSSGLSKIGWMIRRKMRT